MQPFELETRVKPELDHLPANVLAENKDETITSSNIINYYKTSKGSTIHDEIDFNDEWIGVATCNF